MEEDYNSNFENACDFDDLLSKINEIRLSIQSPESRIKNLLYLISDYDEYNPSDHLIDAFGSISRNLDEEGLERMSNFLCLVAESYAQKHTMLDEETISDYIRENAEWIGKDHDIFSFACYDADYADDGVLKLPQYLREFKGENMTLKIIGMDRFMNQFSTRNTNYRRAYFILSELDQRLLENLERNEFKSYEMVDYNDSGHVQFKFSHFEVNTNEPDEKYRTLFIVYAFDMICNHDYKNQEEQ